MKILVIYNIKVQRNKYVGCIINLNDENEEYLFKWKDIMDDKNLCGFFFFFKLELQAVSKLKLVNVPKVI